MLPSAIGAGISQLYDLFQNQSQPTSSPFSVNSTSTSPSTSTSASTSATAGTGGTSTLDSALNQLLLDVQSGSSTTGTTGTSATGADPTTTVANDLQTISSDLQKAGGGHGHHHHHQAEASSESGQTPSSDPTTSSSSSSSTSNPFQNLASSLLAYANTQSLSATQTASTSVTA